MLSEIAHAPTFFEEYERISEASQSKVPGEQAGPSMFFQEPSSFKRPAKSSACSSSIARIPSSIRRVVGSSLSR